MNTHEKYIRETDQHDNYVEWLEKTIKEFETGNKSTVEPNYFKTKNITQRLIDDHSGCKDYDTYVSYEANDLSYQVQIIFPKLLDIVQSERVENIITYWSHIPYVTQEGHYGIEWNTVRGKSVALISIDFTKSASDDIGAREVLDKLSDWICNGTPLKADNSQKYEGVVKPLVVRADEV